MHAPARTAAETPGTEDRSVSPSQVHKSDPDEVYLTRWHRTGPDAFRITASWPETHAFYLVDQACDPLLLCETVRQTFPLLCHAAYDVPVGHQLIWERFSYRIEAHARPGQELGRDVELHVECHDITYRGLRPAALSMRFVITRGGQRVATADTRFTIQTPAVYRRLRGEQADAPRVMAEAPPAPTPLPHRLAGRARAADVVLAPSPPGAYDACGSVRRLRVDTGHPVLFDHAVDHVPGMLLLEAAHQATRLSHGPGRARILALECAFYRYVELDAPCAIITAPLDAPAGDARRLSVTALQDDQVRFSASVTYADPQPAAADRTAA
ncbi:ScbA/BarX family gamma-butyrolactone biosynthesis protein [Streptomyces sp. SP18CS02]|uniref:ScbA/BarX family gamma-butyrolactone biosynthesis protein n=1 Tax=Streptomyces sp. SP18CS02 TaxID=3002531 RepID=UPI002E75B5D9|nr:ScbA/BarX family gamma-butyrolactone biosynthesis protein [Streptomyces sp. SP18CS02]MEE1753360.1 ScbA/BarX family gamma-butyrolactone biosynthesis protein [Streptomyces sp. SP18CS02]